MILVLEPDTIGKLISGSADAPDVAPTTGFPPSNSIRFPAVSYTHLTLPTNREV